MSIHKPVLLEETIENLDLKKGDTAVDATLGGGGHARVILEKIGDTGTLIACDLDEEAIRNFKIQSASWRTKSKARIILVNDNFANLKDILSETGIEKADAILADLGWSSDQLSGRGMSFLEDEDLDMRLDRKQELGAGSVVNDYPAEELERIIKEYGEERWAKRIAKTIVEARKSRRIRTTKELVEIVEKAIPRKFWPKQIPRKSRQGGTRGKHPATRTFQALRIEVNQELKNLEKFIPEALEALSSGGRLAVISFHSLEDRVVKDIFRQNARGCICPPATQLQGVQEKYLADFEEKGMSAIDLEKALRAGPKDFPKCICGEVPRVRIITRKPIVAGEEEVLENPRSRSAKLRVCEKI